MRIYKCMRGAMQRKREEEKEGEGDRVKINDDRW